jgi:TatD DNase family protein
VTQPILGSFGRLEGFAIDSHCHLGLLTAPFDAAISRVLVIAVTNDPAEFAYLSKLYRHNRWIRVAMGLHPAQFDETSPATQEAFLAELETARYIGEVGLDGSASSRATMPAQIAFLRSVLQRIRVGQFVSLHSRNAADEIRDELLQATTPPLVLHWFSGSETVARDLLGAGHLFSLNPRMIASASGRRIIGVVPPDRALAESDAPYATGATGPSLPTSVYTVYSYLSAEWGYPLSAVARQLEGNFRRLVGAVPSSAEHA